MAKAKASTTLSYGIRSHMPSYSRIQPALKLHFIIYIYIFIFIIDVKNVEKKIVYLVLNDNEVIHLKVPPYYPRRCVCVCVLFFLPPPPRIHRL